MNEYTQPSAIARFLGNGYINAGTDYSMAGLAKLAAADLAYGKNKVSGATARATAYGLDASASEVELAAAESANMLRKKYLSAVGAATADAAARGADLQSGGGTFQSVLEQSSMEFGDDMATIDRNANREARSLRTQSAMYEKVAKAYSKSARWNLLGNLVGAGVNLGAGLAALTVGIGGRNVVDANGNTIGKIGGYGTYNG